MFGMGKYDEFDKDNRVSADQLSREIDDLVDRCENHLKYIESALDEAKRYAHGLRGKEVPMELFEEGMSYVSDAAKDMSSFDYANEAALNLRRAGDVALNNHYD